MDDARAKLEQKVSKLIGSGNFDQAIDLYQKILEKDPKDVRALTKMGDIYAKKGDVLSAARIHRQAAEFHSEEGFYSKAVAVYRNILEYDPTNVPVLTKLAETCGFMGQKKESVAHWRNLARVHSDFGDQERSRGALERVLQIDPDDPAAKLQIALSFLDETRTAEAAQLYAQVAESTQKALTAEGRETFLYAAEHAVRLDPSKVQLAVDLSGRLLALKDPTRALHVLRIVYAAQPQNADLLAALGRAFQAAGQKAKTVLVMRQLIDLLERSGQAEQASNLKALIAKMDSASTEGSAARG